MIETKINYIPSFYKVENPYLDKEDDEKDNFWANLIKVTGIFFTMSFIVFFIVNYSFIKAQLVDWKNQNQIASEYQAIVEMKKKENEDNNQDEE